MDNVFTIKVTKEFLEDLRDTINNPKRSGIAQLVGADLTDEKLTVKYIKWNGLLCDLDINLIRE